MKSLQMFFKSKLSVMSLWTWRSVRWFKRCCVMVERRNVFSLRRDEKLRSPKPNLNVSTLQFLGEVVWPWHVLWFYQCSLYLYKNYNIIYLTSLVSLQKKAVWLPVRLLLITNLSMIVSKIVANVMTIYDNDVTS